MPLMESSTDAAGVEYALLLRDLFRARVLHPLLGMDLRLLLLQRACARAPRLLLRRLIGRRGRGERRRICEIVVGKHSRVCRQRATVLNDRRSRGVAHGTHGRVGP